MKTVILLILLHGDGISPSPMIFEPSIKFKSIQECSSVGEKIIEKYGDHFQLRDNYICIDEEG